MNQPSSANPGAGPATPATPPATPAPAAPAPAVQPPAAQAPAGAPPAADAGKAALRSAPAPAATGRVEMLSSEFAMGWGAVSPAKHHASVYAMLDGEVIGFSAANISRADLDRARREGTLDAYAFVIVFTSPVPAGQVQSIKVFAAGHAAELARTKTCGLDRSPPLRVFLMGSPRSGTSELGRTLSKSLALAWMGEGHAAPLFQSAATALGGDEASPNGLVRFMAQQNLRQVAVEAARRAYFYMHGSASFLDKTPGIPMILSAPFLNECFPGSRFIFLRRNPVGNVLSRMVKFGGNFESHCRDWAGAMNEWLKIRTRLPHYVEIEQEEMLANPGKIAGTVADYLGLPDQAQAIADSLKEGSMERTGAGVGKTERSQTGWTPEQLKKFDEICGPAMQVFGYR
jgi:hypothetical protein